MEFSRRYWRNFDWPLLAAAAALIVFGLFVIYSATSTRLLAAGEDPAYYVKRQLLAFVLSLAVMGFAIVVDYSLIRRSSVILYVANLVSLSAVLIFGRTIFGSQRWFRVAGMNIQPSELAKIVMIIVLAHYLEKEERITEWKFLIPLALVGAPMALILLQPDMGTTMVFVGMVFAMLYIAGAELKKLAWAAALGAAATAAAVIVSLQGWLSLIKPYQLNRLLVFVDPYSDPTGSGWNVIQSMIAVGSGGFLGKGFLSGSQNQLNFLPANHTDFIFSVIAEEWGFVGALVILLLYSFMIWRGLLIASRAKDEFAALMAFGCVSMFFFHLVINVGMTIGMMPVTGLPLPFLTYGGSTLLTSLAAVGLLLNVGLRRQKIMF